MSSSDEDLHGLKCLLIVETNAQSSPIFVSDSSNKPIYHNECN